ncbi:MAG: DNA gyrase C-terminal beta-propeller domain-containing protein, partial [Christensenellales bacterium]
NTQANAILDMRLQRLTNLEVFKIKQDLENLHAQIVDFEDILAHEYRVWEIIKTELKEIADKYGEDRKTEISFDYSSIDIGDLIEKEDVVISLTHCGYVKRLPVKEYRAQHRAGKGIVGLTTKEEDFVEKIFVTHSHDDLLFFTSLGKVYRIKAYEIPEASRQAKGRAIVNLLQLSAGEEVTSLIPLKQGQAGYLMMLTKSGLIKKTALSEFDSIRKTGKIAIKLIEGDRLIGAEFTTGNDEVLIATHNGKCIHFAETDVRAMGRDTQGVKSMDLENGDYLVSMICLKNTQQADASQTDAEQKLDEQTQAEQENAQNYKILTVTEKGIGKRCDISEYRLQIRAGKGVKAGVFNEKTGKLVGLKQIGEKDDVILISDQGTIIRMNASEISEFGRDTLGVRVMRVHENEKIVSIAVTPSNEDELVESEADELEKESPASDINMSDELQSNQLSDELNDNQLSDELNDSQVSDLQGEFNTDAEGEI